MRVVLALFVPAFFSLLFAACGGKATVDRSTGDGGTDSCIPGETETCYEGPEGTEGVGICKSGKRLCQDAPTGLCNGQVLPADEICGNGLDDDCNGTVDDPGVCSGGQCRTCAKLVTEGGAVSDLCPGSKPIYDKLLACACATTCQVNCAASFCVSAPPSDSCKQCLGDAKGCGAEFMACAADL
jgi:hypothetical protein